MIICLCEPTFGEDEIHMELDESCKCSWSVTEYRCSFCPILTFPFRFDGFFDLQMHMRMPKPAITDTAIIVAISISERPELSSVVLELVLVLVLEVEAEDV